MAVAQDRRRPDLRRMLRRGERQEAARQPDQGLDVEVVGVVRIGLVIGDAVVDRGRPVVFGIAEVADLDRRGPRGAREQAIILGEAGELDQNVDPVGADQAREVGIVERADVAPRARQAAQVVGDVVGLRDVRIADGLEARAVERWKTGATKYATEWVRKSGER